MNMRPYWNVLRFFSELQPRVYEPKEPIAVEAHRAVRRRGFHTFQTIGGRQVAVASQGDSWYSFLLEAEPTL
jgi:hypothetical protein